LTFRKQPKEVRIQEDVCLERRKVSQVRQ
jgi:hypothetical protein